MEEPTLTFKLHIPEAEVAEGDENIDSLFPHTPRHDKLWYDKEPHAELVEQCLRPGRCTAPEGEMRDWMHKRLAQLGHTCNERGETLMAHTWFECSYAAATRSSVSELLSSANMRLKLGQWALVEQLYGQILGLQLTEAQTEVAQRKLAEVKGLKASGSQSPPPLGPDAELTALLAANAAVGATLPPTEVGRLTEVMRYCGFGANTAGDFEAAQMWFDGAFAVSAELRDLLSAANMRAKLVITSPVAAAAYRHVLASASAGEAEKAMATRKLAAVDEAQATEREKQLRQSSAASDVSYGGNF